jgi:toxin ParE1/3/4
MAYRVEFSDRASRDTEALYLEKNAAESSAASRWYNGLENAVNALATHSHRCPIAPESRRLRRALRHLLYGNTPHIYRVIYEIDEPAQTVWVITIRHGARRTAKRSDVPSR